MRFLFAFMLALLLAGGPARAQREPRIAPPGDWVEQVAIPAPNPAHRDRPIQSLLASSQGLYGAEHIDQYSELAFLVQNAQGLQALGNITLAWQPDQSELIIHKVRIVRAGTAIDLLANGQQFTVLRRENNLESAMLDGVLTAVMQPEGLAAGDVLNFAYTIRRRAATLPLRGETILGLAYGSPIRRYHVRQIWPAGSPIRWRGTGAFERARTRATPLGTELSLDLTDAEGPEPPIQAPARLTIPPMLQVSEHRDWAEIGALIAPHYERAQALGPESPLRREIARIAAASADPRVRTMAALRLVQDEVRYFALFMGDGNYLPATAEQTWTRRFADCKGKVVLLLALLRGLGIEAEPVLVNGTAGDALENFLPLMLAFDHMIVRARIDGRSYWLDGTRAGDRDIEELASSTLGWSLPVRASGSALERIPFAPPALPLTETNILYDGSGGFEAPVPIRMEQVLRGDLATQMRVMLSQVGRDAFLRQMRESMPSAPGDDRQFTEFDLRDDERAGTFTMISSGRTRMEWNRAPGAAGQRFRFDDETIRWTVDFDRPAGPSSDAPFAFPVPAYVASTETVILPNGGQGFSIDGDSFEHLVAGTRISRRLTVAGGRAVARSEFRRLEREVPAAAARASSARIALINDDAAYLRAPVGTAVPRSRNLAEIRPGDAQLLVADGYTKMDENRFAPALADFDRALDLSPEWARAHAYRGMALLQLNRVDEAAAALATALRLDDSEFTGHMGMGLLHMRRGELEQAIPALTRSLALHDENIFALRERSAAYRGLGRMEEALADLDRVVAIEPRHAAGLWDRALLLAHLGREAEAIAAIDAARAADPTNFNLVATRGELLARFGRAGEAAAAFGEALTILDAMIADVPPESRHGFMLEPRMTVLSRSGRHAEALALADAQLRRFAGNVLMLAARCWIRVEANVELDLALRDCNEALEAEPGHPSALPARARLYLRRQKWAEAERDFAQLLAGPNRSRADALHGRGLARLHRGDRAGGESDLAAARREHFDIAREYTRLGLVPPAIQPPPAPATPG